MSKRKRSFGAMTLYIVFIMSLELLILIQDEPKAIVNNYDVAEYNYPKTEEIVTTNNFNSELMNKTIYEGQKYAIADFIPNAELLDYVHVKYHYQNEDMSHYDKAGKYEIVIVFENSYGLRIEKKTTLTIKKKIKKVVKKVKVSTISSTKIEKQILKDDKKLGKYGRLYFSSLYSIALDRPYNTEEAQSIVDAKDSGAYYPYGDIMIIADHAYQGFSIIKSQSIGNYLYIKNIGDDGRLQLEKYIVKEKTTGKNTGKKLITKDNRDIANASNYSLALYTCNSSDGRDITILLLARVK